MMLGGAAHARAQHRKTDGAYLVGVAYGCVGDRGGHPVVSEPRDEDVAQCRPERIAAPVDHHHRAGRRSLDRVAERRGAPVALGAGEILAPGHEANREGRAHDACRDGVERGGAAQPARSHPLLDQRHGQGGGADGAKPLGNALVERGRSTRIDHRMLPVVSQGARDHTGPVSGPQRDTRPDATAVRRAVSSAARTAVREERNQGFGIRIAEDADRAHWCSVDAAP